MLLAQRSLGCLLVLVFSIILPRNSLAVPLQRNAEEVNRKTTALIQHIQKALFIERLKGQLPVDERISGADNVGKEGDDDYLDYNESDTHITLPGEQSWRWVGTSDHLVQELLTASDSAGASGSNTGNNDDDTESYANRVDNVKRRLNFLEKTVDESINKETATEVNSDTEHIEYDSKLHIVDSVMSDIDDLIRLLHAYENVSRSERERLREIESTHTSGAGEQRSERNNSSAVLANVRRVLDVVRQSTDAHPSTTTSDIDPCETVLGVRMTTTRPGHSDPGLRERHARLAVLEEAFHVKFVDNDVYHFEHIEPDVKVTFMGKLLTSPMTGDEVPTDSSSCSRDCFQVGRVKIAEQAMAIERVMEPYLRGRSLVEAMLVWIKMTKLKGMLDQALRGKTSLSSSAFPVVVTVVTVVVNVLSRSRRSHCRYHLSKF
ncbi:hypothetical protein LSAT2_022768 [Lamellibrachia satsuma]|nr:hypothetical protein LSAT2_022768 [Lamellibrachia satsuma]